MPGPKLSSRTALCVTLCILLHPSDNACAFVIPQSSITFSTCSIAQAGSSLHAIPFDAGTSAWLSADIGAQVCDGLRTAVFGIVGLLTIVAAITLFYAQSVLPEQMEKLASIVEEEDPERWAQIQSKLADGETIKDRSDLMAELAEVGVDMMMKETDEEMRSLLAMVRDRKEGVGGIVTLREPLEASLGSTVEEFIAKVDRNSDSKFLTETTRELADELRVEFLKES